MCSLLLGSALAGWPVDAATSWSAHDFLWIRIGALALLFLFHAFTIWLASKAVASQWETHFRYALTVSFLQITLLYLAQQLPRPVILPSAVATWVSLAVSLLAAVVSGLVIPARIYGFGLFRAFCLSLLSFCFTFLVAFMAGAIFFGLEAARARLQAAVPNLKFAPKIIPATPPLLPRTPDLGPEIDGLLETALHPHGPALPLSEREAIVRKLQEKLETQHTNLPLNDASAAAAYQNRLNRYMLLLKAVKAERQSQATRDAAATRQATSGFAPSPP